MARPREFNSDEALERAMQVFWAKGFEAASLNDLIDAMAISKSSFYATFGSKHELFLSAIDRYNDTVASRRVAGLIAAAPTAIEGIRSVFDGVIDDMLSGSETCGCFVNDCAVEMAPHDGATADRVSAGLGHLEQAFFEAIERAREQGRIPAGRDGRALARYLASSVQGLIVMGKANPERAALEDIARITLSALN